MQSPETFDYVIVGAGSAGCVLAGRLSEDPATRVLLLEAGGGDRSPWVRMPIGYGKTFHDRRRNWRYLTEPDPGTGDRRHYWPRGRLVGGSSSINAMVYVRGAAADYDGWAALGNPGWGAAEVAAVYRRMEDFAGGGAGRGRGGPLSVTSMAGAVHPLAGDYLAAAAAAGIAANDDCNGASQEGACIYQVTTRGGRRCSAADAYLHPARRRLNLEVRTGAHVTRIRIDGGRATGVEYVRHGRARAARAAGEVVLAAGAVNSPQLLMLSGIGDAAALAGLGIAAVHHAPRVGANLQDHVGFDHVYEAACPTLNDVLRPWGSRMRAGLRYVLTRGGPLSLSVNQAGGFVRSGPGRDRPNIQLYFSPLSYTRAVPGKRSIVRTDVFSGFMLGASNCHPASRGEVGLASADPFAAPSIRPNYLAEEADLAELVEAAHLLRRIAARPPLAGVIRREVQPGPAVQGDAALAADVRSRSGSVFHPCGTCAMGPDPATAVVDPRLRVHGVEGLRVVDASIFPLIPSGNINAPSMMVGERGAELILEDARR